MFTPKQPYTQGDRYNKINPYSRESKYGERQDIPELYLKIDDTNFLLIDSEHRLIIQPERTGNPYERTSPYAEKEMFTKREVFSNVNPYTNRNVFRK